MRSWKRVLIPAIALALMLAAGARAEAQVVEEFDIASEKLLELDLRSGGSVKISGWERSAVRIEAEPYAKGADPEIEVSRKGEVVRVNLEEGDSREGWRRRGRGGFEVKVQVPVRFNLKIDTMGGGITVADVEGRIEGETMGGKLDLSNLKGRVEMSTMGGNIRLVNSEVNGKVSTMGGQVLLENVIGDVDGSSMGGNVIYKNVRRPDGSSTGTGEVIHITTMGGNIELAEALNGAELETMGGRIAVGRAGNFVDAETMGGDIVLSEVDGRVTASTMGGDVEVRVIGDPNADERDIEISSMSGKVHLTVPANFSMDVEIELAYTKDRAGRYKIESDLGLTIEEDSDWKGHWGDQKRVIRGSGSFAGGKNKVKISTVNGNVVLRQE